MMARSARATSRTPQRPRCGSRTAAANRRDPRRSRSVRAIRARSFVHHHVLESGTAMREAGCVSRPECGPEFCRLPLRHGDAVLAMLVLEVEEDRAITVLVDGRRDHRQPLTLILRLAVRVDPESNLRPR